MKHKADALVQPIPVAIMELTREDALDWARQNSWYHTIDFGDFVASGQFDLRSVFDQYGFPEDMAGMTVLDVGRSSGFFAFEFERRGATVYATELPPTISKDHVSEPPKLTEDNIRRRGSTRKKCFDPETGMRWDFYLARKILGSNVKSLHLKIEELSEDQYGRFDLVFAGSLLNHVRDIAGALKKLYSVTGWLCISATPVSKISPGAPALEVIGRGTTWWVPNAEGMLALTRNAGFEADIHNRALPLPFYDRNMDHVIVHGRR